MTAARKNCVSAILVRKRQFLIEKRKQDDADPGYAIPGGHVESGESLENALRREILEELDINIVDPKLVFIGDHTASDGEQQRIHYFLITRWNGTPNSREAELVTWTSDPKMLSFEVDRKALEKVRSTLV